MNGPVSTAVAVEAIVLIAIFVCAAILTNAGAITRAAQLYFN